MARSSLFDFHVSTLVFLLFLLALAAACQTQATYDTRAADEAALRKLDDEWSKAVGSTKDLEKAVSNYSEDAVVMPPNIPTLTGKEPIRALWKSMLESPGFSGGWQATKVEVARSGDLAYISGNYEFKETDNSGKPITDKGKYLEVWKKQTDGSWKCIADMFNSDLPTVAAPE